jgi:hypothetical protein
MRQALANNWISILMGDWNAVPNPSKDRYPQRSQTTIESSLLKTIIYSGYIDTYRFCNAEEREYTYHQTQDGELKSASRIDSIWVHPAYSNEIESAKIYETVLEARSDHSCIGLNFDVNKYVGQEVYKKYKRLNYRLPKLWNLKLADKENWEKFTKGIEDEVKQIGINNDMNISIDKLWETIRDTIIKEGNKYLPKAREPKNRTNII